ncbi:MAG: alpha-ketoacid dehydrogenase subunit beta [Gemmatimonadota bacterium]
MSPPVAGDVGAAPRTISIKQALYEALAEALETDPRVILMGEDIGPYGGAFGVTQDLWRRFGPERVIITPISENSFVGTALGASMTGLRPVVEIMFMDFITLAMDQLVNHAAKVRYMYDGQYHAPLVVRTAFGGGRGYGPSHSQSLESWFLSVAGLKTVCPSTPADARGLLLQAIADDDPVLFLEHKLLYGEEGPVGSATGSAEDAVPPIGRAVVRRPGEDISVIAYGWMCRAAQQLAEGLETEGVSCEVIDLRSLKPLDRETLAASVSRTGRAVILEEGNRTGGVGAEVAAFLAEECLESLRGRVVRVGAADVPLPAAPSLERAVLPQLEDIVDACRRAFAW